MRRLIVEEPYSKTALWSRRVAVFALAVAAIDIALARGGLDLGAVLAVLGAAILIASIALLCAGAAAVIIWRTGRRGAGIAVAAVFLASVVLGYPGFLAIRAIDLPVLNDVTTDVADPPAFSRSAKALRARAGYTPKSASAAVRAAQQQAYSDVQPVFLDLDADEAYQAILKVAVASGWRVIDATPPSGRFGIGHVDAVARSFLLRFPDDITIRIRPLAGQARVDMRSVSRFGRHDFGVNAQRIEKFAADLQAQVATE